MSPLRRSITGQYLMQRLGFIGKFLIGCTCLVVGCKSAREHREEADKAAYNIIEQKQKSALGRTEPFTVEKPADTLRRRLMLEQNLAHSHPGSLSTKDLKPIKHWPDEKYLEEERAPADNTVVVRGTHPIRMNLFESLQVAARNSREYQQEKETVFRTALALDLERDRFRATFDAVVNGSAVADYSDDEEVISVGISPGIGVSQRLLNGMTLSAGIALDLVRLLSTDQSARGISADASVTMPLLRGAGRHIVAEPLTQAERDVVYAIFDFEQFKKGFVVDIARAYLEVLESVDRLNNQENNYRRVIISGRLSRAFADAGRLPEIQVDQAIQQELAARVSWINAQLALKTALDNFKFELGLPPDANVELERDELLRLSARARQVVREEVPSTQPVNPGTQPAGPVPAAPGSATTQEIVATMPTAEEIELEPPSDVNAGPYELPEARAVQIAFENRPDLRIQQGQVYDAQRLVVVRADALRTGLDLEADVRAGGEDFDLALHRSVYEGSLLLDLPLERTQQRNAYRVALISLEAAVRTLQQFEDQLKLNVRADLRRLLNFREGIQTQYKALAVAERQVKSTELFFQAGRAEVRDLLEAQDELVEAQNAFTSALVNYRVAELELQRDLGVLEVDHEGQWREYSPEGAPVGGAAVGGTAVQEPTDQGTSDQGTSEQGQTERPQ